MFKRPENLPYPKVWHTFKAKDGSSYEIKDLPAEQFEEAVQLMTQNYLTDEPLAKVMNLLAEPGSVEDYLDAWKTSMAQKMPIGCYETGTNKLAGVNFLAVTTKHDPKVDKHYRGEASRVTFTIYNWLLQQFDIYSNLKTDQCLVAYGMGVSREYRNRGIATELLKARIPIMQATGISHTVTYFSAEGTQKAAAKAGYIVYYEVEYVQEND